MRYSLLYKRHDLSIFPVQKGQYERNKTIFNRQVL